MEVLTISNEPAADNCVNQSTQESKGADSRLRFRFKGKEIHMLSETEQLAELYGLESITQTNIHIS